MNVVAPVSRAARGIHERVLPRLPALSTTARVIATLTALWLLTLLSAYLRSRALGASFWIDEGVSLGIASHALADIPHVLRQDGSPPLYYVLLHVWIALVGDDEARTHLLSMAFALACIPVGWWAAHSLFGQRAGWIAAALFALNPFLTTYAQETRMYSLLAFLSLVTSAAFVHAFVRGRRAYLPLFTLGLAAMLYTHNWSWFFALSSVVALLLWLTQHDSRGALLRDAALAYGAVALLVAPWLPTLLSQAQHTGAPWALHPRLASLEQAVYRTLGDGKSAMVLLLAGGAGLAAIRLPRDRALVTSLVVLAAGTAAVAFVYSQFSLAWATRYLSVLVGPLLLLAAAGLARSGRLGLVGLALVAFFWWGMPSVASLHDKSNVETLTSRFAERLRPGDLVISTQPEQVPNLKYYLPAGLRYASTLGPVGDPRLMDWRDARERLQAADAARIQRGVIASVQPGRRILVVAPLTRAGGWRALWTKLVRRRSQQWLQRLAADPSLQPVARWKPTARSKKSTVHAVLYFKRSR